MSKPSWTQPCCNDCWVERYLDQRGDPHRLKPEQREPERCCWCGEETWSGIYIREDPKLVPFPTRDD